MGSRSGTPAKFSEILNRRSLNMQSPSASECAHESEAQADPVEVVVSSVEARAVGAERELAEKDQAVAAIEDDDNDGDYIEGRSDSSSSSDQSSFSSDEEESRDAIKKQVRESLHRTHMHSLNKPLHEQTHFKLDVMADEGNIDEASGEGADSVRLCEDDDPDFGESEESEETVGVSLGNTIAKMDRRIKGEPTPVKEGSPNKFGTPPETKRLGKGELADEAPSSREAKEDGLGDENIDSAFFTPRHGKSLLSKVLNFDSRCDDDKLGEIAKLLDEAPRVAHLKPG